MAADGFETGAAQADALFVNHLAFMAAHRGQVIWGPDFVNIAGHAPFLSSWTPFSAEAVLPKGTEAVRLIPPAGASWNERLAAAGYQAAETLSYMELSRLRSTNAAVSSCCVELAEDEEAALEFAAVQAAAFLTPTSPHREWWIACFNEAAQANFDRADQDFFMVRADGLVVAVMLAVYAGETTGLYAVATRPEYRRKGLSGILLQEARNRALARGFQRLILQAMVGSYAHGYYARLGFEERYVSQVWRTAGQ